MGFDFWYFVLVVVSVFLVGFLTYLLKIKNKQQIHYAFIGFVLGLSMWAIGWVIRIPFIDNINVMFFHFYFNFLGVSIIPVSLVFVGILFANTKIELNWKYKTLCIFPILNYIMISTNPLHRLFFTDNYFLTLDSAGPYFTVHTIGSYLYVTTGLLLLLYFSVKNAGFFSKQSILISIGTIFPIAADLSTILGAKYFYLPLYITPIAFSGMLVFLVLAILKFDFLNVIPIALQKVVDHMSDSFVIIDEDSKIIDFNKPFANTFGNIIRKSDLFKSITDSSIGINHELLKNLINQVSSTKVSVFKEIELNINNSEKYFNVEISPIFNKDKFIAILIILKDVTIIKNTQKQLVERERLASLGELTAGVAHEIKTPLSAIQNYLYQIKGFVKEYEDGVKNHQFDDNDHLGIAGDMLKSINAADATSTKITNIINSIRNHTKNMSEEIILDFNICDVVEDIKVMLAHKLKESNCTLTYQEDRETILNGDSGKFSQVLTNFITNSINAYSNGGEIKISAENKSSDSVLIKVIDYGKGIPERIKDKAFKEMLTTKNTEGTGLGLYISQSIITGSFKGKVWLESEENNGTTIFIQIPIVK